MTAPRIVPPEEARQEFDALATFLHPTERERLSRDLAYTAAVLGEQQEAALGIHTGDHFCSDETGLISWEQEMGPCPTAAALGVMP